ncbi:MAG: GNAT family N-acetyltransferase, partial [Acidimicrobiales bacterium]
PLRYWFDMRRGLDGDPPPTEVPAGLEVRPYDPALDEAVRVAHNEAFEDHWGSSERSEEDWRIWYVGRNFRPDLSFVAIDGEEVAGYLLTDYYAAEVAASGRHEAWVNAVGTRRRWRGRGVARALLVSALRAYRDAGLERGALVVDAANPSGALGLYERLGFKTHMTTISYAKPI